MKPSNLLFIFSDQHNRDTSGCYGHPFVETSNLDRLAAEGTRFTSAYTNCPICVPARASLATGRYVHEIGYWDNAFPYDGRVQGWGHHLISAGRRVESIGKLHYRSEADQDGFSNKIVPLNVVDGVGDVMGAIRDDMPLRKGMRDGILTAGAGNSTYLEYDADIAQKTVAWLNEAATEGDGLPWLLFVGFVCPHPPYIAPPELYEKYAKMQLPIPVQNSAQDRPTHPALAKLRSTMQYEDQFSEEQIRQVNAAYYGMCTYLDRQIGRVLDTLEELGLAENTRVIYSSDHGENMGRRGMWGKFTMYEESVAVPLILKGPDVPAGAVRDDVVSLVDCHPTFLDCLGVEPTEDERALPGESLWPIAQGNSRERSAFSEYHAVASEHAWYMLRSGKYKLIYYVGERPQLFDLDADPDEQTDLAELSEYKDVLAQLESELRTLLDPDAVDARARQDQQALIDRHGGRSAVLGRGTFVNSPAPGETPKFVDGS